MEGKINHKDFPSALLGGGEEVAPRGLWRHRKGTENWVEKYSLTQKKSFTSGGAKALPLLLSRAFNYFIAFHFGTF